MRGARLRQGLIALVLCAQLGCGTILYPYRRGQRQGNIDPGVVLLDAVGLLIFLVPGVVAFAVDFATGAIYLPRGQKSRILATSDRLERIELPERSLAGIEAVLHERGIDVDLARDAVRIAPTEPPADLAGCLTTLGPS